MSSQARIADILHSRADKIVVGKKEDTLDWKAADWIDTLEKKSAEQAATIERLTEDAERYRLLRDAENWGEDSGDTSWQVLGESSMCDFDAIVDARKASLEQTL